MAELLERMTKRGAGKYRRGAVDQERLQAMTDDFRAPLEQDPADAPADE